MVLSQVTTITATGDQTVNVPTGLTNITIVYISVINDADGAHTSIDGTFTFGGVTMTSAFTQVVNGNYKLQCYYIQNYTGGTGNQTMHYGNHGGFGTIGAAVYIFSAASLTQLDATATGNNNGSANPSVSITTLTAGAYLIEAVGGANSLTSASGQTTDLTTDTNIVIGSRLVTSATSYTETWTMSSGSWAMGVVAVKPGAVAGAGNEVFQPISQPTNHYRPTWLSV